MAVSEPGDPVRKKGATTAFVTPRGSLELLDSSHCACAKHRNEGIELSVDYSFIEIELPVDYSFIEIELPVDYSFIEIELPVDYPFRKTKSNN